MNQLHMPLRGNLPVTSEEDAVECHYQPVIQYFYRARLLLAARYLNKKYKRLLDLGCGSGIFLSELALHCEELYGCDLHDKLDAVETFLRKESIPAQISRQDICRLTYPADYFDGIVCMSVLEHIEDVGLALDNILRVAAHDADIILGFPVTSAVMNAGFNAIHKYFLRRRDVKIEQLHVSGHKIIISEIRERLAIHAMSKIPFCYYVCRCGKKRD